MKPKALIFDLDGTLINSLEDITNCANKAISELGFKTHSFEDFKKFVGEGAWNLLKNALPQNTEKEIIDEAYKRYQKYYEQEKFDNTYVYDGIFDLIDFCATQNIKMAVFSNKPHIFTTACVDHFFAKNTFLMTIGQSEETPKKPDPTGALRISKFLEIAPNDIWFVGDTKTDILTAKAASMKSVGCTWGFRSKDELENFGADFIISHPSQLIEILNK